MRRRHGAVAGNTPDDPLEQAELVPHRRAAGLAVALQKRLNALEVGGIDDAGVLAVVDLVLVADLVDVRDVGQQPVQAGPGERLAARISTKKLVESGRVMLI